MTATRDVPVVLFLFNRPEMLERVVDVLRRVRPRVVLVVADGPRPDHPDDAARCRAARAVVDRLGWRCDVSRNAAEINMGCDARLASGLDWAFRQVSEAIVLEDDVVPDPSFFPWCAAMLDRYREEPGVMHVSGRNELGRWTKPGVGHFLLRRGCTWGWATWRRAWERDPEVFPGAPDDIVRHAADCGLDPLVADHFLMLQELARNGDLHGWDTIWELRKAVLGGLSVVPPVNLAGNIGFGPEATHNTFAGDLRALTPVGTAPDISTGNRGERDRRLDRWTLLLDLMATYREPRMIWRIARSARLRDAAPMSADRRLHHHLAPFRNPLESVAVLEHFRAAGAAASPLDGLLRVLRRAMADFSVSAS